MQRLDRQAERQPQVSRRFRRLGRLGGGDFEQGCTHRRQVELPPQQCARTPLDNQALQGQMGRRVRIAELPDVQRPEQGTHRLDDREPTLAQALRHTRQRNGPGLGHDQPRQREQRQQQGKCKTDPPPAPSWLRRRWRRFARVGLLARRHQKAIATEKCGRILPSRTPYARSKARGPAGLRQRAPIP